MSQNAPAPVAPAATNGSFNLTLPDGTKVKPAPVEGLAKYSAPNGTTEYAYDRLDPYPAQSILRPHGTPRQLAAVSAIIRTLLTEGWDTGASAPLVSASKDGRRTILRGHSRAEAFQWMHTNAPNAAKAIGLPEKFPAMDAKTDAGSTAAARLFRDAADNDRRTYPGNSAVYADWLNLGTDEQRISCYGQRTHSIWRKCQRAFTHEQILKICESVEGIGKLEALGTKFRKDTADAIAEIANKAAYSVAVAAGDAHTVAEGKAAAAGRDAAKKYMDSSAVPTEAKEAAAAILDRTIKAATMTKEEKAEAAGEAKATAKRTTDAILQTVRDGLTGEARDYASALIAALQSVDPVASVRHFIMTHAPTPATV